jgi:hypothetical protein
MSNGSKMKQLKAEIAVQRAEKAASEARKSTEELQRLEKTLKAPQVKQATEKVVKQAAESAVDNIIKEKKINNEIKVKTAQSLEKQAGEARKILKNKKKKSFFSKRNILFILLIIGIAAYLWKKNKSIKKPPAPKKFFPKVN